MSPIIDIQYRLRELGRLRMGMQVASSNGKKRPAKLDTWRLTSASRELLEAAAERYGGQVRVWADAPNEGEHFELVSESAALDIVIPPNDTAFSQWMEQWGGGGCQKRCDGQRQILRDVPCSCPSDPAERNELAKTGKACKPTTRFNVILPDIPDVGVWRLETHGYYAAVELAAFQQLADLATSKGSMIRAKLRIDHRTAKRAPEGGKAETRRYIVPVVEVSHTVGDMLQALGASVDDVAISLPAPTEGRSLPGERPELPVAEDFPIEDAERTWLDALREHFSDDTIIGVAEQVRAELGRGKPITTIEQVASAEKAGAHKTIIERLNEQDWGEQGSATAEPTASEASVSGDSGGATPEAETSSATPDSPEGHPPSGDAPGDGDDPSQDEPSSSSPDRASLLEMIDAATTAEIKVGRAKLTIDRALSIASAERMQTDPEAAMFADWKDFAANADDALLHRLVHDVWKLDDRLQGVA